MTLSFSEAASIGDVLSTDKHLLYFPEIPGVGDGKPLTLRHGTVTIPPIDVAQVIVQLFGWPIAFAGRRTLTNAFEVDFVETNDAPVIKMLAAWQDSCAGLKSASGVLKSEYAVDCEFKVKDTTGKAAVTFTLINVWPKTINTSEYNEDSGAMHISCEFSFDGLDLKDVTVTESSFGASSISPGASFVATIKPGATGTFGSSVLNDIQAGLNTTNDIAAQIRAVTSNFPSLATSLRNTFRF